MKKFLLFGAAAMMACAANAQTITEVWAHDMAVAGGAVRNAVIVGDKVAVTDISFSGGADAVKFYDANGLTDKVYDVAAFIAAEKIGTHGTDSVGNPTFSAYNLGRGIAVDAVGNIVVNLAFPNAPSSTNFVAIAPDGTMKHIACEVPSPGAADRADFFGVAGDIFSNGYIALAINKVSYVAVYNIFEGEQDKDYSYLVNADEGTAFNNETKVVFPNKTVDEEAEYAPAFYVYNRSVGGVRSSDGTPANAMVNMAGNFAQGAATCSGVDAFNVNGTDYIVMPTPDAAGARGNAFKVVNVATGEIVVTCQGAAGFAANYAQDFSASVNADGTVNIAQLVQGKYLAMFKLTLPASAIEEVAADNAAVEYFNLQGVKVANPENGIFVKKQGAKATKVVL